MGGLNLVLNLHIRCSIIAEPIRKDWKLIQLYALDDLVAGHPTAGLLDILDESIGQVVRTLPLHYLGKFLPGGGIHHRIIDQQKHPGGDDAHRFCGVIRREGWLYRWGNRIGD